MRATLTFMALMLAVLLPATSVMAHPVAHFKLNKGDTASYTSGNVPGGVNALYFEQAPGVGGAEECSENFDTYCEQILVELTNPVEDDGDPATNLTARRTLFLDLSTAAADYDIILYASDEDGTVGAELSRSTAFPLGDTGESVSASITTSEDDPTEFVILEVIHFAPSTPFTVDARF